MALEDSIPLGKIQHMQVIGPVLDEADIKEVIAHMEKGSIPSMITLILHNQLVLGKRIAQMQATPEPEQATQKKSKKP